MIVTLNTGDTYISVTREVETTEEVAQACYDAMLGLGHAPINVVEAFLAIGEQQADALGWK